MTTRRGKIARLPQTVREELNGRLQNGGAGRDLVAWLNGLPAVKRVLAQGFGGRGITVQNLSEWRKGGFRDWLGQQDAEAKAEDLAAVGTDLSAAAQGRLLESLTTLVAVRYASLMQNWKGLVSPELRRELRALGWLSEQLVRLRRWELKAAELELKRLQLAKETGRCKALRESELIQVNPSKK